MTPKDAARRIMEVEARVIARTFHRHPVVWERGEGARLTDVNGRTCLDFFSGHAVMNLGYGHPRQAEAMRRQLERLVHTGNLFYLESQVELARRLVERSFGDKVLFANSGAEIVELAVKLARKRARAAGATTARHEIVTVAGSFHGRTYGALSATGQPKYHQGLEPMLPGFTHVPLNDSAALRAAVTERTCAVLLEPVQGEGGIRPADPDYLRELAAFCRQQDLLLIFDEIQCGLGRLGARHAYEIFGVTPDVLLLGKPLGGGLPLSALVTRDEIAAALKPGDHGSTFGGNPVAAAGGCVLLDELENPAFLARVRDTGAYLGQRLRELATRHERVRQVRGLGLMWGMELAGQGPEAVRLALERGLVTNCTAGHVLRFLPPLIIGGDEVDEACAVLDGVLHDLERFAQGKGGHA